MKKQLTSMSTREYADLRGISVQAVNNALDKGYRLPGVVNAVKSGRYKILSVDKKELEAFVTNKPG